MRLFATLLLSLLFWASTLGGPALSQTAPAAAEPAAAARAEALLEVLRDESTREALIAELERLAGAAEAGVAPEAEMEMEATGPGVGARFARATQAAAEEAAEAATAFINGLSATQRRLSALWGARGVELVAAVLDLALTVAAAGAAFLALRFGARRLFARLDGVTADSGAVAVAAAFFGGVLIDAAAVALAWAVGYGIALAAVGEAGRIGLNQSLFLNAFLVVEMSKVAIRAVLAPNAARVRLAPLSDSAARYWSRQIGQLASVLGYGLLLAAPLVAEIVSVFSGRAVRVVVQAIVLLWSMALVWLHRAAPRAWLAGRSAESQDDATLRFLERVAGFWHWPALAWLVALFFQAVSGSGLVGPMIAASARGLGVAALGAATGALMGRVAQSGVRLPPAVSAELPMLEGRINGFLRRVLGVARFIVFAATLAGALTASGLANVFGWAAAAFGADFGGRVLSAALVIVAAFILWLGLASWVDYRLDENRGGASARERTLLGLLRNAATVALAVVAGMIALSELGLNIGPLLASAGVLGLAIGFGAQKLVQDVITGVFIQLENAMNVGDVVTVGGVTGVVEQLTIRSVALRDLHGTVHVIPFSSVDMVSNFMKGFSFHVADLGIAYREDVADGRAAMQAAFEELVSDQALGGDVIGPLEWFGVNELGDSAVVLRARIRTRPGKQWAIGRAFNELVKRHCDARGVEIPFPHLTVWFGEGKDGSAPPARIAGGAQGAG